MKTLVKTIGLSALIGLMVILPFMIMEVINRREYDEEFPIVLFSGMWMSIFALSLMLLPVLRGWWAARHPTGDPIPAQGDSLLTRPWPALAISILLLLFVAAVTWLGSIGWKPLERLLNGPDPEQSYLPGFFIMLGLFALSAAAGVIAAGPVARTLRAGGSLFAHPIHLIIVLALISFYAYGFATLVIDQWPCFIGVPVCD